MSCRRSRRLRQIRSSHPGIKVVVLTMHSEISMAVKAFRAGARGYLLKVAPQEEFIAAIENVAKGLVYVSPLVAKDLIDVLIEAARPGGDGEDQLTPRQREVLQLIAEGKTMKEAAGILHISTRTAETHKYEMMQALGVKTTAELVKHAIRLHLVNG